MSRRQQHHRVPLNYSIGRAVLDLLLDFGENMALFESPYNRMKRLWRKELGYPEPKRWRYNRAINYLTRAGQTKIIRQEDRIFIKLTQSGKVRALVERLEKGYQSKPPWDGKWRLILWDIPEESRRQRNQVRKIVKKLGFVQLQKSVFITPFPLTEETIAYLKESGLIKFFRILRVDKMDNESFFIRYFGLKR